MTTDATADPRLSPAAPATVPQPNAAPVSPATPPADPDAAHWRDLLTTLHAAGFHPERIAHPGRTVAELLLRLRAEHPRTLVTLATAYTDAQAGETITTRDIATLATAAGLVTVGFTDAEELTVSLEDRHELHVFSLTRVVALLLQGLQPQTARRAAAPAGAAVPPRIRQ